MTFNNNEKVFVLSGYSRFLPPSKNMHVRLIGDSKLSLGVSVSVCGSLSRLSLCGPVMDWPPVQGVPRLSPDESWGRLQPPCDPTDEWDGIENGWMDGWMDGWKRCSFIIKGAGPQQWVLEHIRSGLVSISIKTRELLQNKSLTYHWLIYTDYLWLLKKWKGVPW